MLDDFDLTDFWEDSAYARESYVEGPFTPDLLRSVELELGFRLPAAYVALVRVQNGGVPSRSCFPTTTPTSWAEGHVAVTGIFGIGRDKPHALLGARGSKFMQSEWGYPTFGICICDCPSAGHDMIMLDYRACGPEGEPSVVHVDQERGYRVTFLAPDFETFVRGLVPASDFDTSKEDLKADLPRAGMPPTVAVEELSPADLGRDLSIAGLLVVWGEPGVVRAALLSTETSRDEVLGRNVEALYGAHPWEVENAERTLRALERFTACLICGGPIGVCSPAVLRGRLEQRGAKSMITVVGGTVADWAMRLWDFTVDSTE